MFKHALFEKHSLLLVVGILVVVSIGGIVEIAPLFYLKSTIEKVDGMRPYTPLELMGRNVYMREGCYTCHSQQIRPLRAEIERYGHYSLAAESMYDHPFQWGSKRSGPDLARVGNKYSDSWNHDHLVNPRSVAPASIMPGYPFLAKNALNYTDIADHMKALKAVGVPYTPEMIENAKADLEAQATINTKGAAGFQQRYQKAQSRAFGGDGSTVTEMDALVAYLQMLGTLVDFNAYQDKADFR